MRVTWVSSPLCPALGILLILGHLNSLPEFLNSVFGLDAPAKVVSELDHAAGRSKTHLLVLAREQGSQHTGGLSHSFDEPAETLRQHFGTELTFPFTKRGFLPPAVDRALAHTRFHRGVSHGPTTGEKEQHRFLSAIVRHFLPRSSRSVFKLTEVNSVHCQLAVPGGPIRLSTPSPESARPTA